MNINETTIVNGWDMHDIKDAGVICLTGFSIGCCISALSQSYISASYEPLYENILMLSGTAVIVSALAYEPVSEIFKGISNLLWTPVRENPAPLTPSRVLIETPLSSVQSAEHSTMTPVTPSRVPIEPPLSSVQSAEHSTMTPVTPSRVPIEPPLSSVQSAEQLTMTPDESIEAFLRDPRNFSSENEQNLALTSYRTSKTPQSSIDQLKSHIIDQSPELQSLKSINITPLLTKYPNISLWLDKIVDPNQHSGVRCWREADLGLRPILAKYVLQFLSTALNDSIFERGIFKEIIDSSVSSCGDGTTYYLNEIVQELEFYQAKNKPLKEALSVFKKYIPVAVAKELALEHAYLNNLYGEETSIRLDFYEKLSAGVPFIHTYYQFHKAPTSIKPEAQKKLKAVMDNNKKLTRYLTLNPKWQAKLLLEASDLKEPLNELENKRNEKLEFIDSFKEQIAHKDYEGALRTLDVNYNKEKARIFAKKTLELLNE